MNLGLQNKIAIVAAASQGLGRAAARQLLISAHSRYTPATAGSRSWAIGVCAPNRYSMHGSAKYSTKVLSPLIEASGNIWARVARKPHSTSAKKGKVTEKTDSTMRDCRKLGTCLPAICDTPVRPTKKPAPCAGSRPAVGSMLTRLA